MAHIFKWATFHLFTVLIHSSHLIAWFSPDSLPYSVHSLAAVGAVVSSLPETALGYRLSGALHTIEEWRLLTLLLCHSLVSVSGLHKWKWNRHLTTPENGYASPAEGIVRESHSDENNQFSCNLFVPFFLTFSFNIDEREKVVSIDSIFLICSDPFCGCVALALLLNNNSTSQPSPHTIVCMRCVRKVNQRDTTNVNNWQTTWLVLLPMASDNAQLWTMCTMNGRWRKCWVGWCRQRRRRPWRRCGCVFGTNTNIKSRNLSRQ